MVSLLYEIVGFIRFCNIAGVLVHMKIFLMVSWQWLSGKERKGTIDDGFIGITVERTASSIFSTFFSN